MVATATTTQKLPRRSTAPPFRGLDLEEAIRRRGGLEADKRRARAGSLQIMENDNIDQILGPRVLSLTSCPGRGAIP